MAMPTHKVKTFPSACLPSSSGGLPVEVCLITQLGHGAGDRLFAESMLRQREHGAFVDELDEPSARLGGADFARGDASSLYSFAVGAKGHPFHRHAGHRMFTAVSGSAGAQLRFSSASQAQIDADPHSFVRALHYINIPPDCLFTVRFGGDTWHQFAPLGHGTAHPAFFALSCHTNELGGALSDAVREKVLANQATIPALTVLLPPEAEACLRAVDGLQVPTIELSLDAPPGSWHASFCRCARRLAGRLRTAATATRRSSGFQADRNVVELAGVPADSLLAGQLPDPPHDHEDMFRLVLAVPYVESTDAATLLGRLLDGFVANPPTSVSRMMSLRNLLVRPLGLRTSPLGCPVSSLLSDDRSQLFQQRHPVLDQQTDADGQRAQVILGADDKHLLFRSCVSVRKLGQRDLEITLGTRIRYRNLFGRLYIALIDRTHRSHVAPVMLRMAAEYAFPSVQMTARRGVPSALPGFSMPIAH